MSEIKDLEIEPLSDEALEQVAGGASSDGPSCCSCSACSNSEKQPGTSTSVQPVID